MPALNTAFPITLLGRADEVILLRWTVSPRGWPSQKCCTIFDLFFLLNRYFALLKHFALSSRLIYVMPQNKYASNG